MFDRLRHWLGMGRAPSPVPGDDPACAGEASAPTCMEALAHLYEYLDGELEGSTPAQVEEHFRICSQCYPHLLCEEAFRDALRRAVGGQDAGDGVRERLLEALSREGLGSG